MFNNNPFFDSMKAFINPELVNNSIKNMTNMDFSSFSNLVTKNAEVINETNRKIAENMQSLARRGSEMFQENVTEAFNNVQSAMKSSDIEQAASSNQQYLRQAVEKSVNQSKELIDMISKSSREIFETVSNNTNQSVNETFNQAKKSC